MVRRVTPSQFRSMIRQQQQKTRQAADRVNRAIRAHNQAVNRYNQAVRSHNARVRANRQRLANEIARLNRHATTSMYSSLRLSVRTVYSAYERLEQASDSGVLDESYNEIVDLSEREAANSAGVVNALLGEPAHGDASPANAAESSLTPSLEDISPELADRWRGALFSLSSQNPDAARHFCTSTREIINNILNLKAPDHTVALEMPECPKTPHGTPTRRAKLQYLMLQAGTNGRELESFVESDLDNIVDLFQVFNEGTHGSAGTFSHPQLRALRNRVEDGIAFLLKVI